MKWLACLLLRHRIVLDLGTGERFCDRCGWTDDDVNGLAS
jgi:hypothetical protein